MLFGKALGKPDIILETIVTRKRTCFFLLFRSNGMSFQKNYENSSRPNNYCFSNQMFLSIWFSDILLYNK